MNALRRLGRDARHYQIACLALFIVLGISQFGIDIRPLNAVAAVAGALGTQVICAWLFRVPLDLRSPMISSMSLCLLLRATGPGLVAAAAAIAIGSKFFIRFRGKHVFNPTNFGIVLLAMLTPSVWISSGQWGSGIWSALLFACLGGVVCYRSARSDIALAVVFFHGALLVGRALWLGDPLAIPFHQLQNGALLVFAFFMISDPKTTPNSRAGRLLFAALVVVAAGWVQFGLFRPNGLLYALAALAPVVPLIDWLFPGRQFAWGDSKNHSTLTKGVHHEHHPVPNVGRVPLPEHVR